MTAGNRLLLFINACYGTPEKYADIVNIGYSAIIKFINDRTFPDLPSLVKFKSSGLSLDWLVDGKGSMYARNETGDLLRRKNYSSDHRSYSKPAERIRYWIIRNYFSLENFAEVFSADYDELFDVIYGDALPGTANIKTLREAGCSIGWIFTGEGSQFENNSAGMILKIRQDGIASIADESCDLKSNDFKLLKVNSPEDLYKLVRIAVKAELQERDKKNEVISKDSDSNIFGF